MPLVAIELICFKNNPKIRIENYSINGAVLDHNFKARCYNGNGTNSKGILNMHLNIRSIRGKMHEIKFIAKKHNPHIFGLSECELTKGAVDEKQLKFPGYDLLFPTSWDVSGQARVVVYVKKTFKYKQITALQDDQVQSVWLQGGYHGSKSIMFCHAYREHLSNQSLANQKIYMEKFLDQ